MFQIAFQASGGLFRIAAKGLNLVVHEGWPGVKRAVADLRVQAGGAYDQSFRSIYSQWIAKYDTLDEMTRIKIKAHIEVMSHKPLISVVMPVYNARPSYLDAAIRSVTAQLYPYWELCVADDASTDPEILDCIRRHASNDPRIAFVCRTNHGDVCQSTNAALELAHGEFVTFLDHDGLVPEHALYWIAAELERYPKADIVYSDSDVLDEQGYRRDPYFKPDFNLPLMLSHNLIGYLSAYRRALIDAVGRMRLGFEGGQNYDLALRVLSRTNLEQVRHIPAVLYHFRRSREDISYSARDASGCVAAARLATGDFLVQQRLAAEVLPVPREPKWRRIRYNVPAPAPKVSAIIPTKNHAKLLDRCVHGLLNATDYNPLEITIIDHDSDEPSAIRLLSRLRKDKRIRILSYSGQFNFAAMNNFAVRETDGDILAFLNNDVEVIHSDWLREMVSHAVQPEIGAVGAKLYYPDGRIQHAGVVVGWGGVAGNLHCCAPGSMAGLYGDAILVREVSAVTAACVVMRRIVFLEVGGFDEVHLAVAYNDVDLCLRLRECGYKNIFTPFAELIHHESVSRGSDLAPQQRARFRQESDYIRRRWEDSLMHDPFFNPNRSLYLISKLAEPPRLRYPWETRGRGQRLP